MQLLINSIPLLASICQLCTLLLSGQCPWSLLPPLSSLTSLSVPLSFHLANEPHPLNQCEFWILNFSVPVPNVQCTIGEKKSQLDWFSKYANQFPIISLNTAREFLHPLQSDSPLTFYQNCLTMIFDVFYFNKSRRNFLFLSLLRSVISKMVSYFLLLKTFCSFSF